MNSVDVCFRENSGRWASPKCRRALGDKPNDWSFAVTEADLIRFVDAQAKNHTQVVKDLPMDVSDHIGCGSFFHNSPVSDEAPWQSGMR